MSNIDTFLAYFGAALALGIVASLTMAADMVAGPRLNEGLGIFGIMPMLGLALGPLLGELMVTHLGFQARFLGATSILVLSIFLLSPCSLVWRLQPMQASPLFTLFK